jgi:anthranilate phosphoribosyltransferase
VIVVRVRETARVAGQFDPRMNTTPGPSEFARPQRPGDLTSAISRLLAGHSLTAEETAAAFEAMMSGQSHHAEIGALLALLATRPPTSAEILGAASVMRRHVERVESRCDPSALVDTAGTGGAMKAFNVSTAAAIVAASVLHDSQTSASERSGVAKHGNRSRTGRGSAEVLLALGVNVDADRATQARCLDEAGVCFCFAIHHHPATRHVMPVRQALGFPTIFNLLGPLTNPAGARRQVMGVYDARLLKPIAEAMRDLGAVRAMVVHSEDGLDEISIAAPTRVMHVENGNVRAEAISPEDAGLPRATLAEVMARDLEHAANLMREIIEGRERGPARDMTLFNAAATLMVAGMAESLREGARMAARAIDGGAAAETLRALVRISNLPL